MPEFLARYGYLALAAALFAEAIGLPVPGAIVLLVAGSSVATGSLQAHIALPVAVAAMVTGDTLLYLLGRKTGWFFLGFLCRISATPETCILRSAESFYRRGRVALVFAKFIPGINTMAPPLAGSMKMSSPQFLVWDAMGTSLYILAYGSAGYLFSELLQSMVRSIRTAATAVEILALAGLIIYIAYRISGYRKSRIYGEVPRISAERLAAETGRHLIADVRSHGYYDSNAQRIPNAIRFEPNNLPVQMLQLSKEEPIYLYCS